MSDEDSEISQEPAADPAQDEALSADPDGAEGDAAPAEEVDPLQAARDELGRVRDQLLRTAADFDNFRKRARRDIQEAERRGREELMRELLPVFDNLERASAHTDSATDVQALADGIRMVMRQFYDTLGRVGVERIDAEGKAFDPALHEAIQHLETTEHAPGTVATMVQAGYRMGDRLIRPAMVVVAKAPN